MDGLILSMQLSVLAILLIGFFGYLIFKFLRVPASAITGSLAMVALFSSQGVTWAEFPSYISTSFQVVIGIMIGCKFTREKASQIKSLLLPGLLVSIWMLCTGLVCGALTSKVTGLDLGTALYGSVPGGMAEMGLIALSHNFNVPVVTLLQFTRVIAVHLGVPEIASKYGSGAKEEAAADTVDTVSENETKKAVNLGVPATLVIGGCSGLIAKHIGVPVGGMLGAMVVVGVLRIMGAHLKELPGPITVIAQIGLGGCLGMTFNQEATYTLQNMLFPTMLFSVIIVVSGIVLGFIVHKVFGWDLTTSLLACAAAGATQMSVVALDMDADAITVGLIQTMRLALIVMSMPLIIAFLLGL